MQSYSSSRFIIIVYIMEMKTINNRITGVGFVLWLLVLTNVANQSKIISFLCILIGYGENLSHSKHVYKWIWWHYKIGDIWWKTAVLFASKFWWAYDCVVRANVYNNILFSQKNFFSHRKNFKQLFRRSIGNLSELIDKT